MIEITEMSTHNHLFIDDIYKLFIVENVIDYTFVNFNTYNINVAPNNKTNTYFIIDLVYHEAFGHWVFESAIYLIIFKQIKEIYSNVKIVLNGKKDYKILFLDFFDIHHSDVVYKENMSSDNICLFPNPITALNDTSVSENYKKMINKFIYFFHNYSTETFSFYDSIVLPRQCKENYLHNDRKYDLTSLYKNLNDTNINFKILNTDEIKTLDEQIKILRSSSNIILTDGSGFLVNNMFCVNSKITIIDNITSHQRLTYKKLKYIIDMCCEINNNVTNHITI